MRVFLRQPVWTLALFASLLGACDQESAPPGPEDVLQQFILGMKQVHGEPEAGDRVVELLWAPARQNLKERARRASALSGRELTPGELIVPSWFALHMTPEEQTARIDGNWAEITLVNAAGEQVKARCIKEEDGWKVALELPPLAPIRQREDAQE